MGRHGHSRVQGRPPRCVAPRRSALPCAHIHTYIYAYNLTGAPKHHVHACVCAVHTCCCCPPYAHNKQGPTYMTAARMACLMACGRAWPSICGPAGLRVHGRTFLLEPHRMRAQLVHLCTQTHVHTYHTMSTCARICNTTHSQAPNPPCLTLPTATCTHSSTLY